MPTVACAVCGAPLSRPPAHLARLKRSPTCSPACRAAGMAGQGHWHWRGGRYIDGQGYRRIWTPDGYQLEHRVVMERRIGRPLAPHETVHHRNGDRLDNRPQNLELCVNVGDHSLAHHVDRDARGRFCPRTPTTRARIRAGLAVTPTSVTSPVA